MLKAFTLCTFIALVSLSNVTYANYTPPDLIYCKLNDANEIDCSRFDKSFLMEGKYTAHLSKNRMKPLYFSRASANEDGSQIYFIYKDIRFAYVSLQATPGTQMDLDSKVWIKTHGGYLCTDRISGCALTR